MKVNWLMPLNRAATVHEVAVLIYLTLMIIWNKQLSFYEFIKYNF